MVSAKIPFSPLFGKSARLSLTSQLQKREPSSSSFRFEARRRGRRGGWQPWKWRIRKLFPFFSTVLQRLLQPPLSKFRGEIMADHLPVSFHSVSHPLFKGKVSFSFVSSSFNNLNCWPEKTRRRKVDRKDFPAPLGSSLPSKRKSSYTFALSNRSCLYFQYFPILIISAPPKSLSVVTSLITNKTRQNSVAVSSSQPQFSSSPSPRPFLREEQWKKFAPKVGWRALGGLCCSRQWGKTDGGLKGCQRSFFNAYKTQNCLCF